MTFILLKQRVHKLSRERKAPIVVSCRSCTFKTAVRIFDEAYLKDFGRHIETWVEIEPVMHHCEQYYEKRIANFIYKKIGKLSKFKEVSFEHPPGWQFGTKYISGIKIAVIEPQEALRLGGHGVP